MSTGLAAGDLEVDGERARIGRTVVKRSTGDRRCRCIDPERPDRRRVAEVAGLVDRADVEVMTRVRKGCRCDPRRGSWRLRPR